MTAFNLPIRKLAKANTDFRRVVATGSHVQVVLMCLQPGDDLGEEVHADTDQVFLVVKGKGEAVLDGSAQALRKGALLLVPAGMRHNLRNTGDKRLRLATLHAPPHHAVDSVHASREDALSAKHAVVSRRSRTASANAKRPSRAR